MPESYDDVLKRDLGITINKNRGSKKRGDDTRFTYGASCSWFGSIHEVGNTGTHLHWAGQDKGTHHLPCCPICGGMLFEMPTEDEWWKSVDDFEAGNYPASTKHPHPGYREMLEWQQKSMFCFKSIYDLRDHFEQVTGIHVDIDK
jgi:hypothetical protein